MPGKPGRSGLPANLNAVKRPWSVFWRRRALGPADRWILPVLESYTAGLIADKGGPGEISSAEQRMIEIAQTARGCTMLILAEAGRKGFIRTNESGDGWDLAPALKDLPKFLGLERSALSDLGLERRARNVDKEIVIRKFAEPPPQHGQDGQ